MKNFLTLAASDTSGGAGIQQDLKMAQRLDFWGLSIITALTAQDLNKVYSMEVVSDKMLIDQCEAIFHNFSISAVKIGVVPSVAFAQIMHKFLKKLDCPVVFDPVIRSSSGFEFSKSEGFDIIKILCDVSTVITPNIPEMDFIRGNMCGTDDLQQIQKELGCSVYLKGGHSISGDIKEFLITDKGIKEFLYPKYDWKYSHGTGCTFSSILSILMVDIDIERACELAQDKLVEVFNC